MSGSVNADQITYWSGDTGEIWVDQQPFLDAMMAPALSLMIARAALWPGAQVLDIGCGTGASLVAAAQEVSGSGHVTGLDVSEPMLERAKDRVHSAGLANVSCLRGDAQVYEFSNMTFDAAISRFGVMFFDNPPEAFANIRRAIRGRGAMTFVAWGGIAHNPWFRLPAEAAKSVVGSPPAPDPYAPGPMAFAERHYIAEILQSAGYSEIGIDSVDLDLTPPGSLADVARFAGLVGPAARILREMNGSEADTDTVIARVADGMAPFETPDGLRVPARLNLVSARAAS